MYFRLLPPVENKRTPTYTFILVSQTNTFINRITNTNRNTIINAQKASYAIPFSTKAHSNHIRMAIFCLHVCVCVRTFYICMRMGLIFISLVVHMTNVDCTQLHINFLSSSSSFISIFLVYVFQFHSSFPVVYSAAT